MSLSRSQLIIIGIAGAVVLFFLLIFAGVIPGFKPTKKGPAGGGEEPAPKVALTVWGVFDSDQAIRNLAPGFSISYKRFKPEEYETELVNALASGKGPDVFMIHNAWLPKFFNKIAPAGGKYSALQLQGAFPSVVTDDFAPDGSVYALPLYLDTLALYYNEDLFRSEAIVFPPKTWTEFKELAPRLRRLDAAHQLTRAAAAIGGSDANINRASDLIGLIMMQSGVPMVRKGFNRVGFGTEGEKPFGFYLQFSDPKSAVYTWNERLPNSLDAFAEGRAAMMFSYEYQRAALKQKNPFLNYQIAEAPQMDREKPVNYANYWGLAVSSQSRSKDAAWNFVIAAAADPANAKKYSEATNHPPALKSLIAERVSREDEAGIFARQALTARSWPQADNLVVEEAFSRAVEDVLSGSLNVKQALGTAAAAVEAAMRRYKDVENFPFRNAGK